MPRLTFREDLVSRLKDVEEAKEFLDACLEDGDPGLFLEALKVVAEAQGGMGAVANRTKLHRSGLYRFFSRQGNPTFKNLTTVVAALGFRLRLERAKPKARKLRAGKRV
jgi:probable addiction module antidote protein